MKRLQSSIWNSLNENALNEKINKDNIEANRIISNPNAGNNAERIKDMGYEVNSNGERIYSVSNKKTGKTIFPSDYSRDEKKKVDFKNKLDSERKGTNKISIRPEYIGKGKGKEIPNSVVVGKDKFGNKVVDYSDYDAYADRASYLDNKPNYKSISKNINDYKDSVKTRDENNENVERYRNSERNYYIKKVNDAQQELDWQDSYYADKEKTANKAEEKRKEILANARAKYRKTNESEELKETVDIETAVLDSYNHLVNDLGLSANIESIYDDVINNYDLDDIAMDLLSENKTYEQIKRTITSILDDNKLDYDLEESTSELKEGSIWVDNSNILNDLLNRAINELEGDELFELLQGMIDRIRDVALEHDIELN